ncbi:hypothetical protein ULF88_11365 [Halopseudomonas pachastrellae]|nr:hypothetical protein [Halopseudomonas pachastrellae]
MSQAQGGTTVALRRGSFGDAVQQLQELLAAQGYPLCRSIVTLARRRSWR